MPELNYIGSGKHKQLGFEWEGFFITDPFTSSCNRFEVDPISEYGLTTEQVMVLLLSPPENMKVLMFLFITLLFVLDMNNTVI